MIWDKGDPHEHAKMFLADTVSNIAASRTHPNEADATTAEVTFETRPFTIKSGLTLPVPVPVDMTQADRARYIAFIQSLYCREDAA